MNLSNAETGCWIDGSHRSNFDFITAVIDLAVDAGFEIDHEQYNKDREWMNSEEDDENIYLDILDALDWTYEDALEFLNTNTRDGFYWDVIDQSLYLVEDEDASQ